MVGSKKIFVSSKCRLVAIAFLQFVDETDRNACVPQQSSHTVAK